MNNTWSLTGHLRNVPIIIDEQLLAQCVQNDNRAQYHLYDLCEHFIMSICIRYAGSKDDADDLLNRSFLKILNNISKYKMEIPFELWVRRITINTIIDEYRKNKKRKEQTEVIDFDAHQNEFDTIAVNDYLAKMDVEQLQNLIDRLPEINRRVFNLFVVDGYNHKEIGNMMGIPEGTSKWHLSNARIRLKELISKAFPHLKTLAS
jgi:RNA polymerase sigma factor (sigma-70 family)